VVIKPRTPSPEPPTPPPSHPATPAASESESESEDERCPPSPEPPPPRAADARLAGKKLRLTVLGVRNAPVGFGDVFCVVECGSAVLETTVPAPPSQRRAGSIRGERVRDFFRRARRVRRRRRRGDGRAREAARARRI
jgi:hypothetical protein